MMRIPIRLIAYGLFLLLVVVLIQFFFACQQTLLFSFAILTDIHAPYNPNNVQSAINWINQNKDAYNIKFVFVLGDITSSAQLSQFQQAKQLLDNLQVPYIPLLGNHDITTPGENVPTGDVAFEQVFSSQFTTISQITQNFQKAPTPVYNPETGSMSRFQNFAFTYQGYRFICLDFNSRKPANYKIYDPLYGLNTYYKNAVDAILDYILNIIQNTPGVTPFTHTYSYPYHIFSLPDMRSDADLHAFTGGTFNWFKSQLQDSYPVVNGIFIFHHHPLSAYSIVSEKIDANQSIPEWLKPFIKQPVTKIVVDPLFTFTPWEKTKYITLIQPYSYKIKGIFAGHTHLYYEDNTYAVPIIETKNAYNGGARIVQVFTNNQIDYSLIKP